MYPPVNRREGLIRRTCTPKNAARNPLEHERVDPDDGDDYENFPVLVIERGCSRIKLRASQRYELLAAKPSNYDEVENRYRRKRAVRFGSRRKLCGIKKKKKEKKMEKSLTKHEKIPNKKIC